MNFIQNFLKAVIILAVFLIALMGIGFMLLSVLFGSTVGAILMIAFVVALISNLLLAIFFLERSEEDEN